MTLFWLPPAFAAIRNLPLENGQVVATSPQRDNEHRVALVIGYSSVRTLPNPRRDADAVAGSLRSVSFRIVCQFVSQAAFDLREFHLGVRVFPECFV